MKEIKKEIWKPGNMLYPLPVVLVSTADGEGRINVFTVAWAGTVCTNPAMLSISVRPERYSYPMIKNTREFVVNLTNRQLVYATDYCGVKSGRDVDKFRELKLTPLPAEHISPPLIQESPVNIECRVKESLELGSHTMFVAEVLAVHADERYMDDHKKFNLSMAEPVVYSHGEYYALGEKLGTFGYSVQKKGNKQRSRRD